MKGKSKRTFRRWASWHARSMSSRAARASSTRCRAVSHSYCFSLPTSANSYNSEASVHSTNASFAASSAFGSAFSATLACPSPVANYRPQFRPFEARRIQPA